jgi:hypothetical protein
MEPSKSPEAQIRGTTRALPFNVMIHARRLAQMILTSRVPPKGDPWLPMIDSFR